MESKDNSTSSGFFSLVEGYKKFGLKWIHKRVLKARFLLHAWYFNLETGTIETYRQATKDFVLLDHNIQGTDEGGNTYVV